MTLRTKIEEAIGERHVHKIDNAELLDQICTIFKEELVKTIATLDDEGEVTSINLNRVFDSLINSLNEGKGQ